VTMSLPSAQVAEIESACDMLQTQSAGAVAELRRRFNGLVVMRVDAHDVLDTPYRPGNSFDLHLLDTSNHCVRLVADPASANGIMLAMHAT